MEGAVSEGAQAFQGRVAVCTSQMSFCVSNKSKHVRRIPRWQGYKFYSAKLKCQGLTPFLNYRMLLSYCVCMCVNQKRSRAQGLPRNTFCFQKREVQTLCTWREKDGIDGIYSKQASDTGLLSLNGGRWREHQPTNASPHPDRFYFLFLNMKNKIQNFWWLNKEKYHILGVLSQQKKL